MEDIQDYFVKGDFITREKFKQGLFKNNFTRYCAYFLKSFLVSLLIQLKKIFKNTNKNYQHTFSVCCIFKNEGQYLQEWINYNLVIGVDHFYFYNNNSDDNYLEILEPFIEKGIVDLIDWPFKHSQMSAYEDCYNNHKNDTNWLAFIDVDEFICPLSESNIKTWLKPYKSYPGVAIHWTQFGSNGKLKHDDSQLVIEQYKQCWPKLSVYTKMFCNMDFPISEFKSPHIFGSKIFGINIPPINQYKNILSFGINRHSQKLNSTIQINHYWGKAYDRFIESKINRTDVYHENDAAMAESRKRLLKSHEAMCTVRNYSIQKFLLYTKLLNSQD